MLLEVIAFNISFDLPDASYFYFNFLIICFVLGVPIQLYSGPTPSSMLMYQSSGPERQYVLQWEEPGSDMYSGSS